VSIGARLVLALALTAVPMGVAKAGPPFNTDDPDPTDYRKFEIYLYSQGTVDSGSKAGTALGLEINYGALPDVQISVALPAGFTAPSRARATLGISDVELGVKYRFIEEDESGWRPQVSFYPALEAPLGKSGKALGDSATHIFLPLWTQKSLGLWTPFGGGGYRVNPGPEGRNSWFMGVGILRRISDRLQLGAEVFHESSEVQGEEAKAGLNIGAIYDLNSRFHIVGSAGPSSDCCKTAEFSYYLAFEWAN